jgi:ketosteroid isomerase-like protein
MKRAWYLAPLLIAVNSCGTTPDLDAVRQAVMDADRAFAQETAANGVAGWVSYFAEDGVQFRPGGTISGHAAIRELMAPAFSDTAYSLTWEPVEARVSRSGDLGYTIGRYQSIRVGPDGEEIVGAGSYVSIWRLQADGSWKVELDIGNPDQS